LSGFYHLYDLRLELKHSTSNKGAVYAEKGTNNANVVDKARGLDLACGTKVFIAIPYFNKASRGCSRESVFIIGVLLVVGQVVL
jgi:hypothetical protein